MREDIWERGSMADDDEKDRMGQNQIGSMREVRMITEKVCEWKYEREKK